MSRNRRPMVKPLFREKFSKYLEETIIFDNGEFRHLTQKAQDSRLSRLTSSIPEALNNGELCADPYDPYQNLYVAIKSNSPTKDKEIDDILNDIKELLKEAQKDSMPDSEYYKKLANWRDAWDIYSNFIKGKYYLKDD